MIEGRRIAFSTADAEKLHRTLEALTETMERLRAQLAELAQGAAAAEEPNDSPARMARMEIYNRALRCHFFDARLFCDPAWDMLLDLFLQELAGRRVCVSSLCMASLAPSTTALRWIRALEDAGLVGRTRDPDNGRRVFVALTGVGHAKIAGYLTALARPAGPAAAEEPDHAIAAK